MQSYAQTARQVSALVAAYKVLINQQPSDTVAMAQVQHDIIALCDREDAIGLDSTATDTDAAIAQLSSAIDTLNWMVTKNVAATSILGGVAAVMNQ